MAGNLVRGRQELQLDGASDVLLCTGVELLLPKSRKEHHRYKTEEM